MGLPTSQPLLRLVGLVIYDCSCLGARLSKYPAMRKRRHGDGDREDTVFSEDVQDNGSSD